MKKPSKKELTIDSLKRERETLYSKLQGSLKEVYQRSAQARVSKTREDFNAYVRASAEYENLYNQLIKVEKQLKVLSATKCASIKNKKRG